MLRVFTCSVPSVTALQANEPQAGLRKRTLPAPPKEESMLIPVRVGCVLSLERGCPTKRDRHGLQKIPRRTALAVGLGLRFRPRLSLGKRMVGGGKGVK
jgi:hypothetical protein